MALNELYEQLRKLREDISEFSDYLEANETGTRQVLIDPLLRVLGWDVSDPTQVRLEYGIAKLGGGKKVADYALMRDGEPVAVVEAKRLRSKLLDDATNAALVEAVARGINYMLVTDGDSWRVYDVFKKAEMDEKLIVAFSVMSDPLSVSAVNALVIWQPNLANQHGPTTGKRHVIGEDDQSDGPDVGPDDPDDAVWSSFADISHTGTQPTRIRFSDGAEYEVRSWRRLPPTVAKHLVEIRKVTKPFRLEGKSRDTVSAQQAYDSDPASVKREEIGKGLWLEMTMTPKDAVSLSKQILEAFGVSAATVKVSFDSSQQG